MTSHPTDFRETALQRLRRRAAWRIRDTWGGTVAGQAIATLVPDLWTPEQV